jgi:hypothetical protein
MRRGTYERLTRALWVHLTTEAIEIARSMRFRFAPKATLRYAGSVAPSGRQRRATSRTACYPRRERPCGSRAQERDERAALHVWMAPAWQEKM